LPAEVIRILSVDPFVLNVTLNPAIVGPTPERFQNDALPVSPLIVEFPVIYKAPPCKWSCCDGVVPIPTLPLNLD